VAGLHDIRNLTGPGVQISDTDRKIVHERYNFTAGDDYDIALLHLKTDLTVTRSVVPVCLPDFNPTENEPTVAIGWGLKNGME